MPRATLPRTKFIPDVPDETIVSEYEITDYSKGMNTYIGNDVMPVKSGQPNQWRLAQDARIGTLGEYETRKGADYHLDAAGVTLDVNINNLTGTADRSFSTTTRLAQTFQTGAVGRLPKVEVRLKNDAGATGTVLVGLYSDSAGAPGTLLAKTSIASSAITNVYAFITARFISAPVLAGAVNYWVVLWVQSTGTGSYKWSSTSSGSDALSSSDSGTTWSSTSYALNLKQYYATDSASKGLHRAYKSDGTKKTLLAHGTVLYKGDDVTGALTSIKTGLSASATKYRFANVNDIAYYVNGFDGIRKWDFTTESQVNTTNATIVCEHRGMLFFADKDDPNKVFYSNFADYETFTSTDFIYVPSPKTGDPVTAMVSISGYLLIFTRYRRYILSGSDNSTFQLVPVGDKGTFTQETVASDKRNVFYLADDGLRRTNGTDDDLLSEAAYEDVKDIANKDRAVLNVNKGRLYLYYSSPAVAANDKCIVFNLNFDAVESYDTETYGAFAVTAFNDDNKILVANSLIGQVYWQELEANDYTNMGGDINFELRTHYMTFGRASTNKQIRYWKPRFAGQSGAYRVTCQYAYDLRDNPVDHATLDTQGSGTLWGSGATWGGGSTWGTSAEVQGDLYVPGEHRRIQLRYKHYAARQPHRFLGHSLVVHSRRMR